MAGGVTSAVRSRSSHFSPRSGTSLRIEVIPRLRMALVYLWSAWHAEEPLQNPDKLILRRGHATPPQQLGRIGNPYGPVRPQSLFFFRGNDGRKKTHTPIFGSKSCLAIKRSVPRNCN